MTKAEALAVALLEWSTQDIKREILSDFRLLRMIGNPIADAYSDLLPILSPLSTRLAADV